jgi:regulatory protein
MQAIGFLSRREYSRQELRTKLLAALRQREREVQAAAAAVAAAEAVARTASNGIDDAFLPRETVQRAVGAGRAGAEAPAEVAADPYPGADPDPGSELGPDPDPGSELGPDPDPDPDPEAQVDTLLDWLQVHGYLSDARFVESRLHARAARQGSARIRQELARHGLALAPEQAAALRETEFARAQAIWQRKFGAVAADARGRAAQARFLAGRGFAAEVVRRIVGGDDEY